MHNINLTEEQLIELGIEIVSAMKADVYNMSIEDGRIDALTNTEIDRLGDFTIDEFNQFPSDRKSMMIQFAHNQKERLHRQALFVATATLKYLADMQKTVTSYPSIQQLLDLLPQELPIDVDTVPPYTLVVNKRAVYYVNAHWDTKHQVCIVGNDTAGALLALYENLVNLRIIK